MAAMTMKPSWIKPATILFASEVPANETAFEFAMAQARQFHAKLILFHAYDTLLVAASDFSSNRYRYYDQAEAIRAEKRNLEPFAERARRAGVECEILVRAGLPEDQILAFAHEHEVDRIVMGTHSPGPVDKLLVGSVAEVVLRSAELPVCIVGPEAASGALREFAINTILCAVSMQEQSGVVAQFAAELAAQHGAGLILLHVIPPQERTEVLVGGTLDIIEMNVQKLVPESLQAQIAIHTIVAPGDPVEELLHQSRSQRADLIVLGAHGASTFAAATRNGIVYKTLARAKCPVIALPPAVLAQFGAMETKPPVKAYLPGVF